MNQASAADARSRQASPPMVTHPSACPRCGGADWRSIRLMYGQEVQHDTTASLGATLLHDWFSGLSSGWVRPQGDVRTELAERIHPPLKKSMARSATVAALAMFCLFNGEIEAWALAAVLGTAAYMLFRPVQRYNTREWPKLMQQWEHMVTCQRCGQVIDCSPHG
jgi:hypothetical protein